MAPERVVILGGGLGALSTAFELSDPRHQGRYDVTVYQLGWRLGGKAASGRTRPLPGAPPADAHAEIIEHGIHVFMGFYENAFSLMRRTYAELDRPPGSPLATWQEAFQPHHSIVLMEHVGGEWLPWEFPLPTMPGEPGRAPDATPQTDPWTICKDWLLHSIEHEAEKILEHLVRAGVDPAASAHPEPPKPHWWDGLLRRHLGGKPSDHFARTATRLLHALVHELEPDPSEHGAAQHSWIGWLLDELRKWFHREANHLLKTHTELRRAFIMFDYALTHLRGILADGLLLPGGFESINHLDWKEWLASHRGSPWMLESPMVSCFYELVFAYPGGDGSGPGDLEAGSQVHLMLTGFGYRGAALYKMTAGMGDVVIAPLYQVLEKRGVRFEFFQRVESLTPAPMQPGAKPRIDTVTISQQVTFPKGGKYEPLFDVKGLPCFPQRPFFEQIVEGPELERDGIDLESHWAKWTDTGPTKVLHHGQHFEHVVYGIGVGPMPFLCADLIGASADWQAMVNAIPTVATQSVILHLKPDLAGLGWNPGKQTHESPTPQRPDGPILGTYTASPLSNWADMSQTIDVESWPPKAVGNIAYLCGMLPTPNHLPPRTQHDYPGAKLAQVEKTTEGFLDQDAGVLWPKAVLEGGRFDRSLLVEAVRYRANVDPAELYAQSPRNSTIHKLPPGGSGFEGLYLAGDWTRNGTNIGNAEGAITSGLQCASAIEEASRHSRQGMRFVDHGGMMSFPAPVALPNSTMHGFLLEGDKARIQAMLDRLFLEPTGGEHRFLALGRKVLLAFANLPHASFPTMPEWGWGKEHDVGFWIPVAGLRRTPDGGYALDRIAWFMPYVWVDQPTALVMGREVFGFLKEFGTSQIPEDPLGGGEYWLDTWMLDKFSPDTEGLFQRLLTLTPKAGAKTGEAAVQSRYEGLGDLHRHLLKTLVPEHGLDLDDGTTIDAGALLKEFEAMLLHQRMPMIFLKQFRGIEGGPGACYQAVTQADFQVRNIRGVRIQPFYDLELRACANIPITADLGIRSQKVPFQLAVSVDLEMLPGKEIWRAGP